MHEPPFKNPHSLPSRTNVGRLQPENLYEFAAAYFAQQLQLAQDQDNDPAVTPPPSTQTGKGLTSLYDQIFSRLQQQAADEQGVTALEACEVLPFCIRISGAHTA